MAPVGVATPARLAPVGVGAGAVGVPTPGDAKAPPVDLELALAERARVGEVVRARVVVRGGQRDGHVLAVERHRGEPGWIVAAAFLDARASLCPSKTPSGAFAGKTRGAVALDHTARSRRVAVAGMSARRTQRAFTLDDEDDDYDVSYVPGISAPPDASTSPRSPAKAAVASHIGSGALIRSTTAAERIQGRFRTWMREKRERLRSAAARVGAAAASSSSSAGGAAGGAPSTPRPPPAQRYARIDSDSDSDHEDTRAARAKHHRAASAGAGRPAGHAPTADGVAADDRPADDDDEHSPRRKLVKCLLLTLAWFGLSTCLALFNKALFGQRKGGFPAPLLLTSVQFLMQYLIAAATLRFVLPQMRPRRPIPWGVYLRQVAPVGVVMGMDIGLSNLSLVYVTVSFYTLAKTSSILFLLAFAFWLRLEPVSLRLTAAALTLTLGEVLTVQGETQFNALGFLPRHRGGGVQRTALGALAAGAARQERAGGDGFGGGATGCTTRPRCSGR